MKKYLVLLYVVFSFLMVQTAAADNLVVNGSFEDPVPFADWTVMEAPSGMTTIAILQNTPIRNFSYSGDYAAGFAAWDQDDDALSQTIKTVAGQTYTFSFWLNHPYSDKANNDFSAYWDGTALLSLASGENNIIDHYKQYTYTVTATGLDTIRFSGRENTYWYYLDDVSVTPNGSVATSSAVPIPPSALLLGSGLLGLAGLGRRRSRKC